jgi:alkylation response protein AidB-like acyl-CoA dehydrogenase
MGLILSPEDADFLAEARAFLAPYRGVDGYLVASDRGRIDAFYKALAARNWLALSWSKEHGGLGRSPLQEFLLWNEVAFEGIARPPQGAGVVAKTIMRHGDAAQKAHWLDRIRRHQGSFALAYSEPEAGSDLASLRCRAVAQGDRYRIDGEKCWNSKAHHADHLWLLCRTGDQASRSAGLSLFIVDAKTPGVRIAPIRLMDGNEFTQITFDGVDISAERRIGPENGAWAMMGESLADERHVHFAPGRVRRDFLIAQRFAETHGLAGDPVVRARLADLLIEVGEAEVLSLRVLEAALAGAEVGWEAAAAKLAHTRTIQNIARAAMDFGCYDAALCDEGVEVLWRQTMTESIGGGTTEIMLGIVARRRLGLGAKR